MDLLLFRVPKTSGDVLKENRNLVQNGCSTSEASAFCRYFNTPETPQNVVSALEKCCLCAMNYDRLSQETWDEFVYLTIYHKTPAKRANDIGTIFEDSRKRGVRDYVRVSSNMKGESE